MTIEELKSKALSDNIPIMRDDTLEYIKNIIKENNINSILEIGAAVGFSAIYMASIDDNIKITTIERDDSRFLCAKENISAFKMETQINLIHGDALEVEVNGLYDLIIIDAAKSKNIEFLEKFSSNLNSKGIIIVDNILFHGLTYHTEDIKSRRLRSLVRKIEKFIDYTESLEDYEVSNLSIGDGIIVLRKKN